MDLLRHLRYFVVVAEELHFGRAADRLHMAQSPLSQRIRTLESSMGVELLIRTTRSVQLTPAGEAMLAEARAILGRVERMEVVMADVRVGHQASLRIALPRGIVPAVLTRLVMVLKDRHAGVLIVPQELSDIEQRNALVDRRLDLGILRYPAPAVVRHGTAIARPLGLLLAASDALATQAAIELSALPSDRGAVMPPRANSPQHYDSLLQACHARGFSPSEVLTADSLEFAAGLVLTTNAIAIVESPVSTPPDTMWRPIAGVGLRASSVVAWRPDDRRNVVLEAAETLRTALIEVGGWEPNEDTSLPSATGTFRPADGF